MALYGTFWLEKWRFRVLISGFLECRRNLNNDKNGVFSLFVKKHHENKVKLDEKLLITFEENAKKRGYTRLS